MKLKLELGYDGPVKAWLDGKKILHDPKGTNPAMPDDAVIDISPKAGEHELVVSLGSNFGKAWGIFLRFLPGKPPRGKGKADDLDKLVPYIIG